MTTAEYTVTYKDFLDSARGYRKVRRGAEAAHFLHLWFLPILCLAMTVALLTILLRGQGAHAGPLYTMILLSVALALFFPLSYWSRLRQAFRLRTSVADSGRVVLSFDDREIVFALPSKTEVRYAWSTITRFAETKDTLTLFIQQAAFHTIPKRDLPETTCNDLKSTIAAHNIPSC